jgi:hypothetical protein
MRGKGTDVLLDTNALFMPFQFGINIESELERLLGKCRIRVPDAVAGEVTGLRKRKHQKAAERLCLKYSRAKCAPGTNVDDMVLELARSTGAVVVTCDRRLQVRIIASGGRVVSLRQRNHLVLLPSHKS